MSFGKCWVCGTVMDGETQREGKVQCARCGWVSEKDGSY